MGIFDNFFQGKSDYELPGYIEKPQKLIAHGVSQLAPQKYTPYKGDMTAGLTSQQNEAMRYLQQLMPNNGQAVTSPRLIDPIPGTGRGQGTIQDYMNPHIAAVLNPALREIRQGTSDALAGADVRANMSGGFRDTGNALERSEATRLGSQTAADTTAKAYSDAFQQAMANRNLDINRLSDNRKTSMEMADQLFGMGGKKQAANQAALTAKYGEFLRKIGYDTDHLKDLASIVGSMQTGQLSQQPSTASSLASLAASIGSIFV